MTDFAGQVYEVLRQVPAGRVTTYGILAKAAGRPGAARAVGTILGKNPRAPFIPCHRVVRADGRVGGFAWGSAKKKALLREEGLKVREGRIVDFSEKVLIAF